MPWCNNFCDHIFVRYVKFVLSNLTNCALFELIEPTIGCNFEWKVIPEKWSCCRSLSREHKSGCIFQVVNKIFSYTYDCLYPLSKPLITILSEQSHQLNVLPITIFSEQSHQLNVLPITTFSEQSHQLNVIPITIFSEQSHDVNLEVLDGC
jgi:hypothetical protein